MKVIINSTDHAIFANKVLLIPGTNLLDSFDAESSEAKAFIGNGDLTVKDSDKMTASDKKDAVKNATTRDAVKGLKKIFKDIDTSEADEKLNKFEEQLKKAQ